MPMRLDHDDPSDFTPHERLREVAVILAGGFHRLRAEPAIASQSEEAGSPFANTEVGQISSKSCHNHLDSSSPSRPDGPRG